ncbi:MAG: hypothetical protein ACQEXJ_17385 [Myxococcota bacterium]
MRRYALPAVIAAALWTLAGCSGSGSDGPQGPATGQDGQIVHGDSEDGPDGAGAGGPDLPDGMVCRVGEIRCADPATVATCANGGADWFETACAEGEGCADGECLPRVCTPGASTLTCLDEGSYERCNDSGTAMEVVECGQGAYCEKGTCIQRLCTPGHTVCKSFQQLKVCNDAGDAWVDGPLCPTGGTCVDGSCLSPCEVNIKDGSYLGCEYWATDLDNIEDSEFQEVGLVVSVPSGATATEVIITNTETGAALSTSQLGVSDTWVDSGQVKVFRLPLGFDVDGTQKSRRTFKLTTTTPVAVHQFNPLNGEDVYTNDASLLLPSKVTGREYFVMAWPHRADTETLRGFATVIATREGTTNVTVRPTAPVAAGNGVGELTPGKEYVFVLEQGEMLNLETDGDHGVDLTGTWIRGDRKISVIGGHECANVPLGIDACDHLEQQLFPVETWSSEYVADSFQPRSSSQVDIWRVMAGDNDVTVTTTPPVPGYEKFKLQRGQWLQFSAAQSFRLQADGPVMVGHYLTGSSYPGAEIVCKNTGIGQDTAIGDPAFTLPAPTKRYLKEYAVLTPDGYKEDYLNIVMPAGATITIDGQPMEVAPTAIPDTGYGIARVEVDPGVHAVEGSEPFGLTAYGYDCDVSYAYPGGLKLQAFGGN